MKKYIIKETWRVMGEIEKYECERTSLKKVKEYIKDWIETWEENAKENDYKFLGFKTDYKTFAKCRIEAGELFGDPMIDTFSLKVINPNNPKVKIYTNKNIKK